MKAVLLKILSIAARGKRRMGQDAVIVEHEQGGRRLILFIPCDRGIADLREIDRFRIRGDGQHFKAELFAFDQILGGNGKHGAIGIDVKAFGKHDPGIRRNAAVCRETVR